MISATLTPISSQPAPTCPPLIRRLSKALIRQTLTTSLTLTLNFLCSISSKKEMLYPSFVCLSLAAKHEFTGFLFYPSRYFFFKKKTDCCCHGNASLYAYPDSTLRCFEGSFFSSSFFFQRTFFSEV